MDHDPSKEARAARKARISKNEQQRLKNLSRSQHGPAATATSAPSVRTLPERKGEIQRSLAMTRASTASMGKFDRMLQGEKKPRGVKRKVSVQSSSFPPTFLTIFFQFEPTEKSVNAEESANLALIRKLEDSSSKKAKRGGGDGSNILNVRKAVRFASRGEGAVALGRKSQKGKPY